MGVKFINNFDLRKFSEMLCIQNLDDVDLLEKRSC
jgi:hypothetical protein